jgi:hypothetical protein
MAAHQIIKLRINNVPLRRIGEIADIPPDRLYNRIDFLTDHCTRIAGHKEWNMAKVVADRHRDLSYFVQMLLATWEGNGHIDIFQFHHAATVERRTS